MRPRCPRCHGVVADADEGVAPIRGLAVEAGDRICACSLADLRTALTQAHVDAGEHGRMWMEAVQAREHAERERDQARAALAAIHTTVCGGNLETPLRAAQRLARDMKAANERLASEPARIAAACEDERAKCDVAWVRAALLVPSHDTSSSGFLTRVKLVARGLAISFDAAVRVYDAANIAGATDADIAAAIRAAREVKP